MASRILRDTTDSEVVDQLSCQAEVLFYRLMMKVDDHGCFYAHPKLVNASCFPLKNYSMNEVLIWLQECEKHGVIKFYESDGKQFLQILKFGQRLRTMKRKFPNPQTNVGDLRTPADNCRPEVETETEEEVETEVETETKTKVRDNVALKLSELKKLSEKFSQEEMDWMFDKLSAYKLSKGKRYKSDYGAILTWVVDSLKQEKEKNSAKKEKYGKQSGTEGRRESVTNLKNLSRAILDDFSSKNSDGSPKS